MALGTTTVIYLAHRPALKAGQSRNSLSLHSNSIGTWSQVEGYTSKAIGIQVYCLLSIWRAALAVTD